MNMNKNNNNALKDSLEREIWLFEQWLSSIEDQPGETQARIRKAYRECIIARKLKLAAVLSKMPVLEAKAL